MHAPTPSREAAARLAGAAFLTSAARPAGFPPADRPEVAFAGRSNAGKSSALNALCARRGLARISKTPGRTQLINFFELPDGRLVDLPGYGFAKVPPKVKQGWQALIEAYLTGRTTLRGVVLIMDSRRPLTDFDRQLLDWGTAAGLHFHLLLTKADKLGRGARANALLGVKKACPEHSAQLFSALSGLGVDEARAAVGGWLGG